MGFKAFAVAAVVLATTAGAAHADIACLIEGKLMSEQIKDCTQTSLPIPAADYAAQCKGNTDATMADGNRLTATVLKACPPKAQAACVGAYGQKFTAYYYARGPQSLADTKKSCIAQDGKWVDKP